MTKATAWRASLVQSRGKGADDAAVERRTMRTKVDKIVISVPAARSDHMHAREPDEKEEEGRRKAVVLVVVRVQWMRMMRYLM